MERVAFISKIASDEVNTSALEAQSISQVSNPMANALLQLRGFCL
jgi:hypothetical protein